VKVNVIETSHGAELALGKKTKSISKQSSRDPARRRMQMQVIVVLIRRPSAGTNENTELEDLKHIPRVGHKLFWDRRDYTVTEVTWDLQGDSVTIGAEV
jgi:hypothetical protein